MKKIIIPGILAFITIILAVVIFNKPAGTNPKAFKVTDNVTVTEDGKQMITIDAKGGYSPRETNAKADVPTLLQIKTKFTMDCSSSLVIPSLKFRKVLPVSGGTIIEVPPQKPGTSIRGLCSMGMYSFNLNFN